MNNKIVIAVGGGLVWSVHVSPELKDVEVDVVDDDNMKADGVTYDERTRRLNDAITGLELVYT